MKYTTGEWKTRGGDKATVVAENPNAEGLSQLIGWVGNNPCCWGDDGRVAPWFMRNDLIAQWTDPVPWDWSTTPPWINWIAKNAKGVWCMFDNEPSEMGNAWSLNGASCHHVPQSNEPKWSGDWKLSKTMRPKGVAK